MDDAIINIIIIIIKQHCLPWYEDCCWILAVATIIMYVPPFQYGDVRAVGEKR